jgi:small-conductance mechanosensitive channel
MNEFWNYAILGNYIQDWLIAFAIIAVIIVALRLLQRIFINRLKLWSAKTKTTIDDFIISAVASSVMPLLYVWAFYIGIHHLDFPDKAEAIIRAAMMVVATFFTLRIISSFIRYLFGRALLNRENNEHREKQSKGILLIIQAIIWLTGLLFLVDNLGYDITTLVAGLGIGGIAIALAAQAILGDLFSYLVI